METVTAGDILRQAPLIAGVGRIERDRLSALARLEGFEAGDEIIREGEDTLVLGIVRRGRLALRLAVPGRGPVTILTVEAGDVFGWSAVVAPYRSTSTVVAIEPSEALVFDAAPLRRVLDEETNLAAVVYSRLLAIVARRLVATRLQLLDLFGPGTDSAW